MGKQIAVIGGGISGIIAAKILQQNGHKVTVFEKHHQIGGVWAFSYPEVRLQNTWHQYSISDFPWPFQPDLHPTAAQILRYLQEAIKTFKLDVRTSHEIKAMQETSTGWQLQIQHEGKVETLPFDYVILASGQYTEGKYKPQFPDQERFQGQILTERDIKDLEVFRGKQVAVVGFGKSALDMATFAAEHGAEVQHIFRSPRWTIPKKVMGIHYSYPLFARVSSVMMTSWAHPTSTERFLHQRLPFVVQGFWKFLAAVFWREVARFGKDEASRLRLQTLKPSHPLLPDLRSAIALAPDNYYAYVASGKIIPHHSPVLGFTETGIRLEQDKHVSADMVVLSVGSQTPSYPFVPAPYRELLENQNDGVQLYRHLIHPRIPNLGFAGFNHGFMHMPSVEVGTFWLCALLEGRLKLPSVEEMESSIEHVRQWKRDHIHYEPSRSLATNTRFQQYLDILLKDLKINPYRKGINVLAEVFARYGAHDYRHLQAEYEKQAAQSFEPLALDT